MFQVAEKTQILSRLLGKTGKNFTVVTPFNCDYGYNIEIGENFFANFNLVVLDEAKVTGDNAFIGPNCAFYTAIHPLDAERRNQGLEYAKPITVGHNVWFGGNVVTKDVPAFSVIAGNPARVIKEVTA